MIVKSYIRMFTEDMDKSLTLLQKLCGKGAPEMRFTMETMALEVATLGSFCVVAGRKEALDPIRSSIGPIVVDDLEAAEKLLLSEGATITVALAEGPAGTFIYAQHADGSLVEYVQWNDATARILGKA